ncbi:MAG TPA: amidase, partial [Burkholderiaceae bacterium]|nr:amidase [Burkholderiaceae bacterium]
MSEIGSMTAKQLAEAFNAGSLSPVDATREALARIDAWEPSINAMYLVHRESALAAARESEARWRERRALSPIDGVPVTIKDNIATRGDPAPVGTAANELSPKSDDAPPAARLREAGCVMLGKTTMPDFGMLSAGLSSLHGITRNPWRLDRNPSGSSSGAAAAAVAGYGPLHLGTDIGGSVRLPATHCGLFALKPSLGRIPIHPPFMGRVAGPMTRTVADSALMMDVLSRPDPRDWMCLPYQPLQFAQRLDGLDPKGLRIGFLAEMGVGLPVHPEVAAAAGAAARALERAGAIVEPMRSFLTSEMFDGVHAWF